MDPNPRQLAPVLRVDELRALEARYAGASLMERAGLAAAETIRKLLAQRAGGVVILAGPGNNGGDGFVVARWLRSWFYDVRVVFPGDTGALPTDAAAAFTAFAAAGGTTLPTPPQGRPALVVDALFGIGLARPLAHEYATLVKWANSQQAVVVALDIPTGLHADTGTSGATAIRATHTTTFLALKPGLLTGDGPDLCGEVSVHPLDVDAHDAGGGRALDWPTLAATSTGPLGRSRRSVHKGSFGTLAIVGGTNGMVGAALIAARAAMRSGAGKVRVGLVARERPAFDPSTPELMLTDAGTLIDQEADAWVIGCGLGSDQTAEEVVTRAIGREAPLVLDADALNLIAAHPSLAVAASERKAPTLATPHPAEAARLLGTTVAEVQGDRLAAAHAIAQKLRAHVVLKGSGSVLAHPDGSWDINTSGNAGLAFAGSGDALSGMLGAFVAQRIPAKDALRLAVCLHGAAADALVARGIGPIGVDTGLLTDAARSLLNDVARKALADDLRRPGG